MVKAFNIIGNTYFVEPRFGDDQPTMFIAGDDEDARATVAEVLVWFGWPPPVDIGGMVGARLLEPLALLWVAVGFGRGRRFDHGFKLLTG